MRWLIFSLLVLHGVAASAVPADIMALINEGRLEEARRAIKESSATIGESGSLLLAKGMLEENGPNSFRLLEAASQAGLSDEPAGEVCYRTALYFQATENYRSLADSADAYLKRWAKGRYRNEMMRLAAMAKQKGGEREQADILRERLIKENGENRIGALGRLDKMGQLLAERKFAEADKLGKKLMASPIDEASIPSMYMAAVSFLDRGKDDNALFQYNLLREEYPNAIGLGDLEDKFGNMEKQTDDEEAEQMTGTVYSVQVGVFSVKANADKIAARMKKFGQGVEIGEKSISGKKYYVVFAGRFRSSERAMAFKGNLEQSEQETYQVVAR